MTASSNPFETQARDLLNNYRSKSLRVDKNWHKGVTNKILHDDIQKFLLREIVAALLSLHQAEVKRARVEELENLKQYHGAYIGMDGKRVDDMVHHQIIDKRLAELHLELADAPTLDQASYQRFSQKVDEL